MPKTTPLKEENLLDSVADKNLRRSDQVLPEEDRALFRKKWRYLAPLYQRMDTNYPKFSCDSGVNFRLTQLETMTKFYSRPVFDAFTFRVDCKSSSDMVVIDLLCDFLVQEYQVLKSVRIDGWIGDPYDYSKYYAESSSFGMEVYKKLSAAFSKMPNLDTIDFQGIRWIPKDDEIAVIYDLFSTHHNISKIHFPKSDFTMDQVVVDSLRKALDSRPTEKPFLQTRWSLKDFEFLDINDEKSVWQPTHKVLADMQSHFLLSLEERKPFLSNQPSHSSSST